jgi:hypothetical protein
MKPSISKTEEKNQDSQLDAQLDDSKHAISLVNASKYQKLIDESNLNSLRSRIAIQQNGQWHQPLITSNVFLESASTLIHTSGPQHMIPR